MTDYFTDKTYAPSTNTAPVDTRRGLVSRSLAGLDNGVGLDIPGPYVPSTGPLPTFDMNDSITRSVMGVDRLPRLPLPESDAPIIFKDISNIFGT